MLIFLCFSLNILFVNQKHINRHYQKRTNIVNNSYKTDNVKSTNHKYYKISSFSLRNTLTYMYCTTKKIYTACNIVHNYHMLMFSCCKNTQPSIVNMMLSLCITYNLLCNPYMYEFIGRDILLSDNSCNSLAFNCKIDNYHHILYKCY